MNFSVRLFLKNSTEQFFDFLTFNRIKILIKSLHIVYINVKFSSFVLTIVLLHFTFIHNVDILKFLCFFLLPENCIRKEFTTWSGYIDYRSNFQDGKLEDGRFVYTFWFTGPSKVRRDVWLQISQSYFISWSTNLTVDARFVPDSTALFLRPWSLLPHISRFFRSGTSRPTALSLPRLHHFARSSQCDL